MYEEVLYELLLEYCTPSTIVALNHQSSVHYFCV